MHMKKNIESWKILLQDPIAVTAIVLIVIHQTIIASSAFFLTRLIEHHEAGTPFKTYLCLFIISMIVPFIPGCLSLLVLQHWINKAHKKYIDWFSSVMFAKTEVYLQTESKETVESMLSRNSFGIISGYISFIHNFFTFFLNSILSMIVIGFLLPSQLITGYLISFVLSVGIILILKLSIQKCAIENESHFIKYGQSLGGVWKNAVLGNIYNFSIWTKEKNCFAKKYYAASNKLAAIMQLGNLLLGLAALIPTCYLIYHLITGEAVEAVLAAAVIVNLTRIFHILNSLSTLIYQTLDWSAMNARMCLLFDMRTLLNIASQTLPKTFGPLTINDVVVNSLYVEVKKIQEQKHGRFTIRGMNGSGKSTFLLELKKAAGTDAMLLPANINDLCWQSNYQDLSTGQRVLNILNEASEIENVRYLLLDEWDANLDTDNVQRINELLSVIAQHRVIVEIRH
ncbi:hypothetical protein C7W93_18395 [Glaciimonas sp. PCH181]|nr:hypothetical protein C7W93_18395 [Glaciimonas sp. PCH181]